MSAKTKQLRRVVALSGGVGGARLAYGLSRALPPEALTVIVNTGDDFEHWGLWISPDVDTVMYTLAELSHDERGFGVVGDAFLALDGMKRYGEDAWFALGDKDLATHLARTNGRRRGETLSAITARLCKANGVPCSVLPMSDDRVRTRIDTKDHGTLDFQDWFVRKRAPAVDRVRFEGVARAAPGVIAAIEAADAIVFGPSNPYVSIHPILSLPGVREAIAKKPVVCVSPIVGGRAVKGPLAEMIPALAKEAPTPGAIVRHYAGLVGGIVLERGDEGSVSGARVLATDTVMTSREDRTRLAREALAFVTELAAELVG